MVSAVASRCLGTHCAKSRMHVRCKSANVRPCKGSIAATAGSHAVSAITAHRTTPTPADRGACRADAVEQGTAEEEDDDLGGDRKRPQHARRAWADSCSAPTDHRKGVVHRMTPKNQHCEQNHLAIEWQSQQHSNPASVARRGPGVATRRQ